MTRWTSFPLLARDSARIGSLHVGIRCVYRLYIRAPAGRVGQLRAVYNAVELEAMNSFFSDPAVWSRLQFAFTITYHYLFPQLTMGLAWFLVYWKWRALRTGDEKYN